MFTHEKGKGYKTKGKGGKGKGGKLKRQVTFSFSKSS